MRKRIFRIKTPATDRPIVYGKIKDLYEAHNDYIPVTLGALMNAVCKKGEWHNGCVKVERLYITPAIEDNGRLIKFDE